MLGLQLFQLVGVRMLEWQSFEVAGFQILANPPPALEYAPGTWGPEAAEALIGADGPWRDPKPPKAG